jgi:membrane protein implicated in regulation of membrane protease activity
MNEAERLRNRRVGSWIGTAISLLFVAIISKFFGKYPLVVALISFLWVAGLVVFWRFLNRMVQAPDRRPAHTTRDILEAAERRPKSGDKSAGAG